MRNLVRAFICVEITNEGIVNKFLNEVENLSSFKGVRPVRANQLHLTLKFLGDVNLIQIEKIKESLDTIDLSFFDINIFGIGCFPNFNNIRVIWIGITDGRKKLVKLASTIDTKMNELGFQKEKREYSPHITLARIKRIDYSTKLQLKDIIIKKRKIEFGNETISNIILKKSTLTPQGPIYENIHEVTLPKPVY